MDEPYEVTLDRELIETLFRVLSPICREEMEAALDANSAEMSMECQREIEINLESISNENDPARKTVSDIDYKAAASSTAYSPLLLISIFIVVFLLAVGGYVYFVQTAMQITKKTKKLSKKKVTATRLIHVSERICDFLSTIPIFCMNSSRKRK